MWTSFLTTLGRSARQGRGVLKGRVAKILGVENYAPSMGALRSDQAISGPSNRFTDLVEVGEQASRRTVRRRFFRALNVCDTPVQGGVVHLQAALEEQLLDVTVAER